MTNFGWIPWDRRTNQENRAVEKAMANMPRFAVHGVSRSFRAEKALLWECWKDPRVVSATGGKVYPGNHQLTGCCVGAGGGNTVFSLMAVEVARLNQPEIACVPFWLLDYGISRLLLGERGEGEGSTGTTFALAVHDFGVIPASTQGLPPYTSEDGLIWGAREEMHWSNGAAIPQTYLTQAKKTLVRGTAPIKSADECRESVVNGFPVAWCGDWGGKMQCDIRGTPPVLLNTRQGTWNHQQSCHGWWDHPTLGEIFYILNQWGLQAHGICPSGAPPGGYWVAKTDCEYQTRNGECFSYSQFDGFPAPDWEIPWLF